jgi:hypothetical protein
MDRRTYVGEEIGFYLTAVASGCDLLSIDSFIAGEHLFALGGAKVMGKGESQIKDGSPCVADEQTRSELSDMRQKAFRAYEFGAISEMVALLKALEWRCRYLGLCAVAKVPVAQWQSSSRRAAKAGAGERDRFGVRDESHFGEGDSLAALVRRLKSFNNHDIKPAELWCELLGKLSENPYGQMQEKTRPVAGRRKSPVSVSFIAGGKVREIKYSSFSSIVARERK